jgi:glutamate/tyrosine decarboxylase-like PLP-dependent enzyme
MHLYKYLIALVVTQIWIHKDFLERYFISIIIYKNPKKLRKILKFKKYIFFESTASFHQNQVHRVKPCRPG